MDNNSNRYDLEFPPADPPSDDALEEGTSSSSLSDNDTIKIWVTEPGHCKHTQTFKCGCTVRIGLLKARQVIQSPIHNVPLLRKPEYWYVEYQQPLRCEGNRMEKRSKELIITLGKL